jgi:hypothetical protein
MDLGDTGWVRLAQDRDRWRVIVNTVTNLRFMAPQNYFAVLASCTMGTGGPFPGGKVRPGRYADHSPPSSSEV